MKPIVNLSGLCFPRASVHRRIQGGRRAGGDPHLREQEMDLSFYKAMGLPQAGGRRQRQECQDQAPRGTAPGSGWMEQEQGMAWKPH